MANSIKQTNDGFNSIYKGNFSIGINDNVPYGGTLDTGFWNTIPATGSSTGDVTYAYIPKGSDGPSIYEMPTFGLNFLTAGNQIKTLVDGPYITTSTFDTTRNIIIPSSSTASTYPLEFNVTGITSNVNFVTLTLGILSGSNVQNLGIVLVAPDNTTYALIKGSLSSPEATGGEISVNLSQYKGVFEFVSGPWNGYSGGTYNSKSYNESLGLTFEAPCPVGPFSANTSYNSMTNLTGLLSGDTNGTWSLYIQDFGGDSSTLLYSNLSFTYGALTQAQEFLTWAESTNNVALINRDYPSINLSGLQLHIDPWYLPSANSSAISSFLSAGKVVSDLTNNNNDAVTTNGISLDGTNYESWNFFGNNPFNFNSPTNIPAGNSAYTISVWFKTSYNSVGLVSFGTNSGYDLNFLYINSGGYLVNSWAGSSITSTGSTVSNNAWHNVAVTYDGTVASIYVDGALDTDLTVGTSLSVSPTSNLKIAEGIGDLSTNDYTGNLGPVLIYNRELSLSEISTNYNNINSSHGY